MDFLTPDIVGIVTGISGLLLALTNRRKLKADAANAITESAIALVVPLKNEVVELRATVLDLTTRLRGLEEETREQKIKIDAQDRHIAVLSKQLRLNYEGALKLVGQIEELDKKPIYIPRDIDG